MHQAESKCRCDFTDCQNSCNSCVALSHEDDLCHSPLSLLLIRSHGMSSKSHTHHTQHLSHTHSHPDGGHIPPTATSRILDLPIFQTGIPLFLVPGSRSHQLRCPTPHVTGAGSCTGTHKGNIHCGMYVCVAHLTDVTLTLCVCLSFAGPASNRWGCLYCLCVVSGVPVVCLASFSCVICCQ